MSKQEPYFPVPGVESYRKAAAPAPRVEEAPPKRVVVSRPDTDAREPDDRPVKVVPIQNVARAERTYWQRHRLFVRYPRAIGAVILVLGALLTWSALDTLWHGGVYLTKATVIGPVGASAGLWCVLVGYPLNEDGRPPPWWVAGIVIATVVGFLSGFALLAALKS